MKLIKKFDRKNPQIFVLELSETQKIITQTHNIILLVCVAIAIYYVLFVERTLEKFNSIFLPIFMTIYPFTIIFLYPRSKTISSKAGIKPIFQKKLTFTGACLLALIMNLIAFLARGWSESAIALLAICYLTAFSLPLKPLFNETITSLPDWTKTDFILKTITVVALSIITGHLWASLNQPNYVTRLLTRDSYLWIQITGITILIPFYLGIHLAKVKRFVDLKIHSFDKEVLKEKFGQ